MLSIETEARTVKLLLSIADGEKAVELAKGVLGDNPEFDPYQVFLRLDREGKNSIDEFNIINFLKTNSIFCSFSDARFIIMFYDSNSDGKLSYSEFLNLLLSDITGFLRKSPRNRLDSSRLLLPYDVEYSVSKVFERELELVRNLQLMLNDLKTRYDFNVYDLFSSMQTFSYLTDESLREFLTRNRAYYNEEDIKSILKRFDIDKDGRISYTEFKRVFTFPLNEKVSDTFSSSKTLLNSNSTVNLNSSTGFNNFSRSNLNFNQRTTSPPRVTPLAKTYSLSPEPRRFSPNLSLRLSPERKFSPLRGSGRFSPNRFSPKRETMMSRSPLRDNLTKSTSSFYNSRTYSNLISYEEETFLSFLRTLMECENDIEKAKSDLVLRPDFNVEDAFRTFELAERGFITELDLKYGLNAMNIFPTNDEVKLLMKRYDLRNEGVINYPNFFDMLAPFDKDYRNMVENRLPSPYVLQYNKADVFLSTTKLYLQNLFKLLISSENRIERLRQRLIKMSRFDLKEIFAKIDRLDSGSLSEIDLESYMKRNGIVFLTRECELLFIRLDRSRYGKVTFSNFYEEVSPKIYDYLI